MALVSLLLASLPGLADVVIYDDSFSRQGALSGSAPEQGSARWTADPAWQISGNRASVTSYSRLAFLPFQPRPNNLYTLSAIVNCASASPSYEWLALGFANGLTSSGAWHTANNPVGWLLLRYQSDSDHQAQAFLGPGSANGKNVGVYSGPHTMTIVLDTRSATNWTFQFKIDGTTVLGPLPYGLSAPVITSVGIGNGAGLGWVDDFSLTAANADSSYTTADIAASIRAVTTPMRGSTHLLLPTVPPGYQLTIRDSSNPAVVDTDGTIRPPLTNTVPILVLRVTRTADGQTADTGTIKLMVPSGRAREPLVHYSENFSLRYGLNITWTGAPDGMGNPIVFSDGSRAYSMDQFANSVNVPAVVDQIAGFGFEYIILTDFHGYQTTLHPCAALDSWRGPGCTATRDVVGELIAGLKARGIRVYLFTHPLDGYDGFTSQQQAWVGWNDPNDGYRRWNDYINDVYAEIVERYGDDLAGIQFDSDFGMVDPQTYGKLDLARLRQTILSRRPQLSLTALAGPNDTAELGWKEVWRPSWLDPWNSKSETDYDVEAWPAYLRVLSAVEGYHWGPIVPPGQGIARLSGAQMFRYTVLQAGIATEGAGTAWAASPYTDGTWENHLGPALTNLSAYVKPIAESIRNTLPSTAYPNPEGTWLSTLPYGLVATRSREGAIEYLHVLNPPSGKTLSLPLPLDGRRFISASLLPNGNPVSLVTNIGGLSLSLSPLDTWDPLNTVIKLLVDPSSLPPANLALHRSVSASSSVQFGPAWGTTTPWGRIRLVDDQVSAVIASNGWSAGNLGFSTKPRPSSGAEWVSLDLESTNYVNQVQLYPRSDAGNVGYGYPISFDISTSLDGSTWSLAVSLANQARPSTARMLQFPTRPARYVRLNASQLRANPSDGGRYALQLSELRVFGYRTLSPLDLQKIDHAVVLRWTNGVLQAAGSLVDSFLDVAGAASPLTNSTALPAQFFRLRY